MLIRSRYSATIEAAMPELRDLDSPEFAPIRARLARAYLEHKADIGAAHADDAEIVARVDAISEVMLAAMKRALTTRHKPWLMRYSWFVDLVNELLDDLPGKPLDS
jgi:hypothetical protein